MCTAGVPAIRGAARALAILALMLTGLSSAAQTVALTFDDGPSLRPTPLLSPTQRNDALLRALAEHAVPAALFVTVAFGADRPEGLAMAHAWGEAGHRVGNHTVTHLDLHDAGVSLAQYQKEVLDCDAVIRALPGYRRWFRYTYLREGDSAEQRDAMRAFLQSVGYLNAYVTLDSRDWAHDPLVEAALNKDRSVDLAPLKHAYLALVWQRAQDKLAELKQQGRGKDALVLLLHHNLSNALWLGDLLALCKARGWRFVSPDEVYDPGVARQPAARGG
jgi:peptidoglycan-N-acetylglucosamine deacetylase